ncbi:NAD-P-binding protein [Trametes elegans]|nr:NAD-P-binding protein [Trametes elegans]
MSPPRIWFITGASSGFGRLLTEIILEKGEIAIATSRRPNALDALTSKYPKERLLTPRVDVNNPAEIAAAFAQAQVAFGRIDIVVNNAAYGVLGEVESVREEDARAMFETNFWGAMHVTREAVRFFREVNGPSVGGRLLQVSSITGITGGPNLGFYSATKSALEGLTESLAAEIDPAWNIKITLIEPAGFSTGGQDKVSWGPPHPAYSNPELPGTKMRAGFAQYGGGLDARQGAEVLYRIAAVEDLPLHFPLGDRAILHTRKKAQALLADTEKTESWSAGIKHVQ